MTSTDAPSTDPPNGLKPESTGNFWLDLQEAFRVTDSFSILRGKTFSEHGFRKGKRLSPLDDLRHLDQIPCARTSLMSGIASGVGLGVVRAFSTCECVLHATPPRSAEPEDT
jgi:hypothetical protein